MQVIALRTLKHFWERQPQSEVPLRHWYRAVSSAAWTGPADVKRQFGATVDFVAGSRAIFDIGGNKFRLIVFIAYRSHRVFIKFIGTHAEYDKIDPVTCEVKRASP